MPTIGLVSGTSTVVPTGGSFNQLLVKNTAAAGALTWADPGTAGSGERIFTTGYWYDNRFTASGNNGNSSFSAGSFYSPFYIGKAVNTDALAVASWVDSGSPTGFLGLYSSDPTTGLPQTLRDSGSFTFQLNSQQINTVNLAGTQSLAVGWHWIGFAFTGTTPYICGYDGSVSSAANTVIGPVGQPNVLSTAMYTAYTSTATSLASSPTVSVTVFTPIVYFRAAA